MSDFTHAFIDSSPVPITQSTPVMTLALLPFIGAHINEWQIHRCLVIEATITQHAPMKLIYHYEHLEDSIKAQYPLSGSLLSQFDTLMSRERFTQLLGVPLKSVAMPWQLKFSGKLVVFFANPEIALRLHWTNTLKDFEAVYHTDLTQAITQSFAKWQFVGAVEVVNKNPNLVLTIERAHQPDWQLVASPQFEVLPAEVAQWIQQFLHDHAQVQNIWLAAIQDSAHKKAKPYLMANDA